MKKGSTRLLVIVGLVALVLCSWYMLIDSTAKENKLYNSYLTQARENAEAKLYDQALEFYTQAMEYRDSISLRDEVAQLYKEHFSASNYEKFCEQIVRDYPYEALGYERLATFYRDSEAYYTVFDIVENAGKRRVKSEMLDALVQELYYAYELRENSAVAVGAYSSGFCPVQRESGKWGLVNNNGDVALSSHYQFVSAVNGNNCLVLQDMDGTFMLWDLKKDRAMRYAPEGLAIEACTPLISEKMAVKYNGKYHYVNEKFEELFGAYDEAGSFYCGVAAVRNGNKWAIINEKGEQVTDFIYEDVKLDDKAIAFRGDRALVKYNGKYIMIDTKGKQVGSDSWEDADAFNADLVAAVCKGGKWGFVNKSAEVVVDYQYQEAKSFSNGFAAVKISNKWGYIDAETHQLVIDAIFDEACDFATKGNVFVRSQALWYVLRIYRLK